MACAYSYYMPTKATKASSHIYPSAFRREIHAYASNNALGGKKSYKANCSFLNSNRDPSFFLLRKNKNSAVEKGRGREEREVMNSLWQSFKSFVLFRKKFESDFVTAKRNKCHIKKNNVSMSSSLYSSSSSSSTSCVYAIANSSASSSSSSLSLKTNTRLLLPIPIRRTIFDGPRGPIKVTKNEIKINKLVGLTPHSNNHMHNFKNKFYKKCTTNCHQHNLHKNNYKHIHQSHEQLFHDFDDFETSADSVEFSTI